MYRDIYLYTLYIYRESEKEREMERERGRLYVYSSKDGNSFSKDGIFWTDMPNKMMTYLRMFCNSSQ